MARRPPADSPAPPPEPSPSWWTPLVADSDADAPVTDLAQESSSVDTDPDH
jgi:hypothetical protein